MTLYDLDDPQQGIVHVIGPELGLTQPGMTIVCGDSHTATHGAFGALAFGIGTSEVEHVLATQTLLQQKPKTLEIRIDGRLAVGVTAKDAILWIIGRISTSGGTGHCIEYTGEAIRGMTHGRADDGLQHDDRGGRPGGHDRPRRHDLSLSGRPAPVAEGLQRRRARWKTLPSDAGARYDRVEAFDAGQIEPQVTWGTNPGQVVDDRRPRPRPGDMRQSPTIARRPRRPCTTWAWPAATPIHDIPVDRVFIGSCTNGRIEDLRAAAAVVRGHHVADRVAAMVVPGSGLVKRQAEAEGLDKIFTAAGLEWREPGCSMCLAMNPDKLEPGQRCAVDQQSQLRGPAGQGRPHPPRFPRHGRRRRHRWAFRRYAAVEL